MDPQPSKSNATPPAAKDPAIGDRMPDGTVYAGVSPESCKLMYAMSSDASLTI
jgi:hypothetical protein